MERQLAIKAEAALRRQHIVQQLMQRETRRLTTIRTPDLMEPTLRELYLTISQTPFGDPRVTNPDSILARFRPRTNTPEEINRYKILLSDLCNWINSYLSYAIPKGLVLTLQHNPGTNRYEPVFTKVSDAWVRQQGGWAKIEHDIEWRWQLVATELDATTRTQDVSVMPVVGRKSYMGVPLMDWLNN